MIPPVSRLLSAVLLFAAWAGDPLSAGSSCAEDEVCEATAQVPAEHRGLPGDTKEETGAMLAQSDLTLIPVEIDPLGAPPDTPWTVFAAALNVRTEPSTRGGSATVVGSLPRDTEIAGDYYIVAESDEEWLEISFGGATRYISRTGVTRPHPFNVQNIAAFTNLPVGTEIVNRWWAVPISYEPNDLVEVPLDYTNNVAGREYLLRRAARDAVLAMIDAARSEGVDFRVASPYRSGARQTTIYQNAVNNNLAQRSSAPPGHSEHQLGTTTDFSLAPSGRFLNNTDPAYLWLAEHAVRFGFVQTYTAENTAETGYIEEPWHWRYLIDPVEVARQEGIQQVLDDPGAFGLFTEAEMAASRLEGQADVLNDPGAFNLFTESSILDLNFGGLMLQATEGALELEFILELSNDLGTWEVNERIFRTFELGPQQSFLRVRAGPRLTEPEGY